MYKCDFCHSNFSYKISLENHIKTAKYCLKIQNKESHTFKCDKILSTKQRLEYHMITHFSKECDHCKKVFNREKKYDLHFNNCIPYLLSLKLQKENKCIFAAIQIKFKNSLTLPNLPISNNGIEKNEYDDRFVVISEDEYEPNF